MVGSILPISEEDYRFFRALTKAINKVRGGREGGREGGRKGECPVVGGYRPLSSARIDGIFPHSLIPLSSLPLSLSPAVARS